MTKEQRNLIDQRAESKRLRRLRAHFNGRIKDEVHNPGFSLEKGGAHEYRVWATKW